MKAVYFKYYIAVLFAICTVNSFGQDKCKCDIDIDFFFQTHFISLDTTIKCDTIKKFVKTEDVKFVMLIGFMSGINYDLHSYTGQPQLNYSKILEYRLWYKDNRKGIKCDIVKKGLQLLETDFITDEIINELEKLRIK
jgi:hypothetical protein